MSSSAEFTGIFFIETNRKTEFGCDNQFIITACLLVSSLGGEPAETAQLFSKEIENGPDNMDAILDAAYTHPAFTDVALLSLLHI